MNKNNFAIKKCNRIPVFTKDLRTDRQNLFQVRYINKFGIPYDLGNIYPFVSLPLPTRSAKKVEISGIAQ